MLLRRIVLSIALVSALLLAVVFAALNPGAVTLDLGFFETRMQKSLALTLAFGAGWLFGLACLAAFVLRIALEPRRLRHALRLAESEIHTLRSLPPTHAD
ncbi:MAG: LapA family protein [Gammaproteobacteria bacterium]|nr:LapA family protein [Gammaproteobacteria bacterium]